MQNISAREISASMCGEGSLIGRCPLSFPGAKADRRLLLWLETLNDVVLLLLTQQKKRRAFHVVQSTSTPTCIQHLFVQTGRLSTAERTAARKTVFTRLTVSVFLSQASILHVCVFCWSCHRCVKAFKVEIL